MKQSGDPQRVPYQPSDPLVSLVSARLSDEPQSRELVKRLREATKSGELAADLARASRAVANLSLNVRVPEIQSALVRNGQPASEFDVVQMLARVGELVPTLAREYPQFFSRVVSGAGLRLSPLQTVRGLSVFTGEVGNIEAEAYRIPLTERVLLGARDILRPAPISIESLVVTLDKLYRHATEHHKAFSRGSYTDPKDMESVAKAHRQGAAIAGAYDGWLRVLRGRVEFRGHCTFEQLAAVLLEANPRSFETVAQQNAAIKRAAFKQEEELLRRNPKFVSVSDMFADELSAYFERHKGVKPAQSGVAVVSGISIRSAVLGKEPSGDRIVLQDGKFSVSERVRIKSLDAAVIFRKCEVNGRAGITLEDVVSSTAFGHTELFAALSAMVSISRAGPQHLPLAVAPSLIPKARQYKSTLQ